MNYSIVITNLSVIFLLIAVGFAAGRAKIVSDRASGDFTALLMQVTLPCTIFGSMLREFDSRLVRDSGIIFLLGFVLFGGGMLLALQVSKLLRIPKAKQSVWVLSSALCNTGFMGFPLIVAVFGSDGLFLASIMNLSYNIVAYTAGVKVICMNSAEQGKTNWKKILLTNVNFSIALGLIFFLLQLPVPAPVRTTVTHLGNITTPLSMFLIGLSLAKGRIREVFQDKEVFSCVFMRLLCLPALTILLIKVLPLPQGSLIGGVAALTLSMPCPSMAMMLAQQYHENVDMASKTIFMSSLFSIATIPLMMLFI